MFPYCGLFIVIPSSQWGLVLVCRLFKGADKLPQPRGVGPKVIHPHPGDTYKINAASCPVWGRVGLDADSDVINKAKPE